MSAQLSKSLPSFMQENKYKDKIELFRKAFFTLFKAPNPDNQEEMWDFGKCRVCVASKLIILIFNKNYDLFCVFVDAPEASRANVAPIKKVNGWTNLYGHLATHNTAALQQFFDAYLSDPTNATGPINSHVEKYIDDDIKEYFEWIELIIMGNHPFDIVDKMFRKFAKRKGMAIKTLMKYLHLLGEAVVKKIAAMLKDKPLGIMHDAWSNLSDHYLAVFATATVDDKVKEVFLGKLILAI